MFMTRGILLGQDPSGTQSALASTVCGAWSAWCRWLPRTGCQNEFRHCGQPGHHARTCPLNRQGTAAAHPHACFSKGCSSTASCTPLHAQTHTHAHTHAHTYKHKRMREYTQTHTCTHTHTHTHTHTCICTHTLSA